MMQIGIGLGILMSAGRRVAPAVDPVLAMFSSGEQGAYYDPSRAGVLFQDSAGTTPVAADGDPVGLMLDLSGRGNHAVQATPSHRPTYKTAGGLHWLAFDGIDDTMAAPAATSALGANESYSGLIADYDHVGFSVNRGLMTSGVGTSNSSRAIGVSGTGFIKVDSGGNPAPEDIAVPLTAALWEARFGAASRVALNGGSFLSGTNPNNTSAGGVILGLGVTLSHRAFKMYGLLQLLRLITDTERAEWVAISEEKGGFTI